MKKKFLGGITILAIAIVAAWNVNLVSVEKHFLSFAMINIDVLANGENDCPDDEQERTVRGECEDGKNCECVVCQKGSTDCSPTCPCC